MTDLSDKALGEMLAYCEKATEGPWYATICGDVRSALTCELLLTGGADNSYRDAAFTTHARTDLPAVVKALQEARGLLRELLKIAEFYAPGDDNVAACTFDDTRDFLGGDDE
jgi:hypothetical protein